MGYVITIEPQIRARQNLTILNPREDLREIIDNDMGMEVAQLYDDVIRDLEEEYSEESTGDDYEAIADGLHNKLVDFMNELEEILSAQRINRNRLEKLREKVNAEL